MTRRKTPVQQLLADLVGVASVNPAFVAESSGVTGEQRVAELLAQRGERLGLEVEYQPVLPERANLLARLEPVGCSRGRVLLAPHLDTVGLPGDWARLFAPVIKGDRLHGRGACDTKGSVAAMFTALERVARSGRRPDKTEIVFAGLIDEENAQAGSRALARQRWKADLAIVGEPTELRVITAHKGDVWLRIEVEGLSAHGARPELGVNAVHKMAKVVDLLETTYAAQLAKRNHPLLGRATVNVGSISGGTQPNIVPDHCFITVDRRTLPRETETTVRRELTALLREHGLDGTLAMARTAPCLPLETDLQLPLVRRFLAAATQTDPAGVDYFCDAAVLAEGGIPSVVFGPGDIAQAHTADEWISLRSVERATDILERFFRALP